MKTPDEIKKGLECCQPRWNGKELTVSCTECPYKTEGFWCRNQLLGNARMYLVKLEQRHADVNASPFDGGMSQAEYLNGEAREDA